MRGEGEGAGVWGVRVKVLGCKGRVRGLSRGGMVEGA